MPVAELEKIAGILLSKGLTAENIERAADFIVACGKKFTSEFSERFERWKMKKGELKNSEIPPEMKKEATDLLKEIAKSQSIPVYMDGIAFFFNEMMEQEEKALLEKILTNLGEDTEAPVWEDEQECNYQKAVDNFMRNYYGCSPDKDEEDFWIDNDALYLNFNDYGYDFKVCDDMAIRTLADALNHLLGEKYITSFVIY